MYRFLFLILFFVPQLVAAATIDSYTRLPAGNPTYSPISITFTASGFSGANSLLWNLHDPINGNQFTNCTTNISGDTVSATVANGTVDRVDMIPYVNADCTNNQTPVTQGDAFTVGDPPPVPSGLATTTIVDNPAQNIAYGMLVFLGFMWFAVWFFSKKK